MAWLSIPSIRVLKTNGHTNLSLQIVYRIHAFNSINGWDVILCPVELHFSVIYLTLEDEPSHYQHIKTRTNENSQYAYICGSWTPSVEMDTKGTPCSKCMISNEHNPTLRWPSFAREIKYLISKSKSYWLIYRLSLAFCRIFRNRPHKSTEVEI